VTSWNILVATLGQRGERFRRLLDGLLPQLEPHAGQVTVTALWNNGERTIGEYRQALLESATSTYVSFVDDDDEVPSYFVDKIVPLLDGTVDYVGWRMQCWIDGRKLRPTYHSIRYSRWYDDRRGYYRHVSHLNPIRTELARLGDFRRDWPEDISWVNQVRPFVKTEHYVGDVMYHYHSSTTDTVQRPGLIRPGTYVRPNVASSYFSYHPESVP
jgi:hypothetical protein